MAIVKPLSLTVTWKVSAGSVVRTTFLGTLAMRTGMGISVSYVSFSVIKSQNSPLKPRKNKKIRNSLFNQLNRKFLTILYMCAKPRSIVKL